MAKLNAYFGEFGGQFVPQILVPALDQLEQAFIDAQQDDAFRAEFMSLLQEYAGRPTALTLTQNITKGTKTKLYRAQNQPSFGPSPARQTYGQT